MKRAQKPSVGDLASSWWTPHYLSGKRFGDRAKRLRAMDPASLRRMQRDRRKLIAFLNREISLLEREVTRQRPKRIAYYWFDSHNNDARFAIAHPDGDHRRDVHPLKPNTRAGQYPMPHSTELQAWFAGNGVTHVIAETGDTTTSPECIAKGKHTVAKFLAWWRLMEHDDE